MDDATPNLRQSAALRSLKSNCPLLAHSCWDAIPVVLGILHCAAVISLVAYFHAMSWPLFLACAFLYAVSLSWSINSIAHNFIHNPYFTWHPLNRAFSVLLSVTIGFSQAMYHYVHLWHHVGNMDRPGPDGNTIDYLSIYRYGKDGRAENPWAYTFKSYFRDDPGELLRRIGVKHPEDVRFAKIELAIVAVFYAALLWVDWRAVLALVPFYYFGQSLSSLNGFYEHFGADPDRPIAWGVSTYNRLYNWTWMNNGYHAEHHYRPKVHWTQMKALHEAIADQQKAAGVRTIRWSHALGFLDRSLPAR
jgi:fatty acid desaturase